MNLRASLDGIYLLIPTGDNNIIVITDIISKPPLKSSLLIFVTMPNYFLLVESFTAFA